MVEKVLGVEVCDAYIVINTNPDPDFYHLGVW